MEIFKNRPFSLFCALFMLSSTAGFFLAGNVKLLLAAVFAGAILVVIIFFMIRKSFSFIPVLLVSALVFGIASSYICFDIGYAEMRQHDGDNKTVRALVTDTSYYSDYCTSYTVRVVSIDGVKVEKLAYLTCEYRGSLVPGDLFEMRASISEPQDDTFGYSHKISMLADGITAVITSEEEDFQIIERNIVTPEIWFLDLNNELSVRLSRIVGGEEGDLAAAVFLADRSGVSEKTELDFSRCGTSHLLALSGLHMAIVAAIAEFFLSMLRIKRSVRCVLLAILLVFYLALIGFALSAVRSVIMIAAVYLTYILRSHGDSITSLFFAGFLILLISPTAVCDIGFWMSFFATFGIIIFSPYISKLFSAKRVDGTLKIKARLVLKYFVSAIAVTVIANLSVIFFSCFFFGEISLISPLTNLILAPLTVPLIFFSAMTTLFSFILPAVAGLSAKLAAAVAKLILSVSEYFSEFRGTVLSLEYDFAGIIVCLFVITTVILLVIKLKHKILVLAPAVLSVIAFCICLGIYTDQNYGKTDISYLCQKNGEIFLLSECGTSVLIDNSEGYYSRFSSAKALLREHEATELEVLILTHYHSRQSSAVKRFFDNCKIRSIWLPEPQDESEYKIFCELYSIAEAAGVEAIIYRRGEAMKLFKENELMIFPYRKLDRSVEAQVGFSVTCGERSLVYIGSSFFEGDAAPEARSAIAESDYLILGAHGPKSKDPMIVAPKSSAEIILANAEFIKIKDLNPENVILSPEYARFSLAPSP
ncbi:MAG: ComEC/Rec2 family competence protein [Ruminococcaceae bacterium]|nr:ComEC/Rec2 family competence protein [Oscillospiraceae bacterium]